jgi:hypothetical protein
MHQSSIDSKLNHSARRKALNACIQTLIATPFWGQSTPELRRTAAGPQTKARPSTVREVSQAYCSALPVAYGRQPAERWGDFAQLILDAAYEATLAATVINATRTGSRVVCLTLLGGGIFGNCDDWIMAAIDRAFRKHAQHGLDVRIISYSRSKPVVAELVSHLNRI